MVDYSTLSIVLTGIGLIVAITYYTMTLRNAEKARHREQTNRRAQGADLECMRAWTDRMYGYDWETPRARRELEAYNLRLTLIALA